MSACAPRGRNAVYRGLVDVRRLDDSLVIYVPEGAAAIARIVPMLNEASLTTEEISAARPTLDDVFLRATSHLLAQGASPATPTAGRLR